MFTYFIPLTVNLTKNSKLEKFVHELNALCKLSGSSMGALRELVAVAGIKIHEEGGFWTEVMGRRVCVKLWIHFIAGDTSGHNNLVGHMNGGWPKFIYQDCRCLFDDLSSPIQMCSLITSEELKQACLTEDGLTNLSQKNISNAFENVLVGDLKYGLLGSVSAEMLQVSGTGLLKHMFGCLDNLIGGPNSKKKTRNHLMICTVVE
jgi:hypothetical protein